MYLSKLLLRDFGKFHNEEIELKPGINVVKEKGNGGRSVISDFITGMFYGIHKGSGINGGEGKYEEYKPSGRSKYSGSLMVKDEDKSYLVDRDFMANTRKTSVIEVQSGREVRLSEKDSLHGTVISTDKNSFQDTMCISETEDSPKLCLLNYVSNMLTTGTATLSKEKAIRYLENEAEKQNTKPLAHRISDISSKLEAYEDVEDKIAENAKAQKDLSDEFAMEAAKRRRVSRKMVEEEDGKVTYEKDAELEMKLDRLEANKNAYGAEETEEEEEKEEIKFTDRFPVIIGAGLLVVFVIWMIVSLLPFEDAVRKVFVIFTALLVILTIIDGLRTKGFFDDDEMETPSEEEFTKVLEELQEESEKREEIELDMAFAKEYQDKKDALKKEEKALLVRKNEKERLKKAQADVFKKMAEMEEEIYSIRLAINEIERISKECVAMAEEKLVPHISEMLSPLSGGRMNELVFDEEGISVSGPRGKINIFGLSEQDASIVYLAVRLSVAKYYAKEALPIIIEQVTAFSDERTVDNFLNCVKEFGERQFIIISSDSEVDIASIMTGRGAVVNRVKI